MAYGLKCYCCGVNKPNSPELYYCKSCLLILSKAFEANNKGILRNPQHYDHCISCGEWEDRRIIWTGHTALFPSIKGAGVPICECCIKEELLKQA